MEKIATHNVFEQIVSRISDPQIAVSGLGLSDAVIRKFGDQLTVNDLLSHAREMILGHKYATETPKDQDSPLVRSAARDTAIHWLRSAEIGRESWLHHSDTAIRTFGRRMYMALNPDNFSEKKLSGLKTEWQL